MTAFVRIDMDAWPTFQDAFPDVGAVEGGRWCISTDAPMETTLRELHHWLNGRFGCNWYELAHLKLVPCDEDGPEQLGHRVDDSTALFDLADGRDRVFLAAIPVAGGV